MASSVDLKQASSERITGCKLTSASFPYSYRIRRAFSLIIPVSSQCVTMGSVDEEKMS